MDRAEDRGAEQSRRQRKRQKSKQGSWQRGRVEYQGSGPGRAATGAGLEATAATEAKPEVDRVAIEATGGIGGSKAKAAGGASGKRS